MAAAAAAATPSLPTVLSLSTGSTGASASAGAAPEKKAEPRDWDLTHVIAQYLDRHMILPLIEFAQEKQLYPERDLWLAKLELVSRTKMMDYYTEEYTKYHKTAPDVKKLEFTTDAVNSLLKEGKASCGPLLALLNETELIDQMRKDQRFTLENLKTSHNITEEMVQNLYRYAKLAFDCGRYRDAADYLYYFRLLSKDEEKRFWALWGKLAAEILMVNCESAMDDLVHLRDAIDNRKGDHVVQLQQRTWLIHWSLFIFFNSDGGHSGILDFIFNDNKLLNALQTTCPHVLRYIACSAIIKRNKKVLKELVRVVTAEKDTYSDPLVDFLKSLYVEFDFEAAQKKLKQCESLMANDFFLGSSSAELLESARQLVFETYARTHQCIDINLLAQRLDIKVDAKAGSADAKDAAAAGAAGAGAGAGAGGNVEQKIVELIRNVRADVKIDAKKNQIVMDSSRHPSIYQQVLDKTESHTHRAQLLASEIDKRVQQKLDAKNDRD